LRFSFCVVGVNSRRWLFSIANTAQAEACGYETAEAAVPHNQVKSEEITSP
jgi:hypothetical protein